MDDYIYFAVTIIFRALYILYTNVKEIIPSTLEKCIVELWRLSLKGLDLRSGFYRPRELFV